MSNWYPRNPKELNEILEKLISQKLDIKPKGKINGIIVPHAGYQYSGAIAGKAFELLKDQPFKRAIVIGPDHYIGFKEFASLNSINTPLGSPKISENPFQKTNYEHSIDNQIPFIQKLNPEAEILPIIVGDVTEIQIKNLIEILIKKYYDSETIFIISTDLSHFMPYQNAIKKDTNTIKIIETLDFKKISDLNACGKYPLNIAMNICRIKHWQPHLIEYKNSGDILPERNSVVGYASMYF
jgi:hypothetical protein